MPASNIGVRGSRWLLGHSFFLAVNAMICSRYSSPCASCVISNSASVSSFAINSPLIRCSLGTLQFLINRLTQLLTRTSDCPNSSCPLEETRYHLDNCAEFKRQFFSSIMAKVEQFGSALWICSLSSSACIICFRSAFTSVHTPVGVEDLRSGQSPSGSTRKLGLFHHISVSANSQTVSPLVP